MKMVVVRLPDDIYRELEEAARREGYSLVSDYVKRLILQALGKGGPSLRDIEERLSRLEAGELPTPLYERIGSIVRSILQEEGVSSVDVEGLAEKLEKRVERRIHDMINPWTGKVDRLAQELAGVVERLETLEEEVKKLREEVEKLKEARERVERQPAEQVAAQQPRRYQPHYHAHTGFEAGEERHARRRRRTAIEWLHEQGVLFESELTRLRDRDAFFDKLRREGAVVIELPHERVAVDREFWEEFVRRIENLGTTREDEIRVLLGDKMAKLFEKLKSAGIVYFDVKEGRWRLSRSDIEGGG